MALPLGYRLFHNHAQLDPAYNGRWLVRLPDRSLVYLDEYEAQLAAYEAREHRSGSPACGADAEA